MNRKSVLLGAGIVALLGVVAVMFLLLLHHEPDFYRRDIDIPPVVRKQLSNKFFQEFIQLYEDVSGSTTWSASFQEKCINSYFDEQFVRSGLAKSVLPEAISAPRIAIEPDKIRVAFLYGNGVFKTVISIDMRMWLTQKEPNVIALELQGLHAGSLPIAAQSLLEQVSEAARQNNIDVTWYRHNGNPVALLRFQADQDRPTFRLEHLVLKKGEITVSGRSIDENPLRAMLPVAILNPSTN